MTPQAREAILAADRVVGYLTYLDLIKDLIEGKETVGTAMMQEVDRCQQAVDLAVEGHQVVVVSSGDSGVYGMAGLVLELANKVPAEKRPSVDIVPGLSAVNVAASVLGAPLMHDFAVISLSDLMTPWDLIKKRADLCAQGDMVISLYNPRSKKRVTHLDEVREIVLKYRDPKTPVGIVQKAGRPGQQMVISDLENFTKEEVDMQTLVIIGNSQTYVENGRMITPPRLQIMIWVIAGTLDGRTLAVDIQERTGEDVLVTVVSQYGAELAAHKGITVHTGRLDQQAMQNLIKEHDVRLLIDASHPYAAVVTATAQDAAKAVGIPFVRFERKEVPLPEYDKLHIVVDEVEAANLAGKLAKENNNHVYLTTGSKTMHIFAKSEALQDCEVWTRILPTAEVLQMMEDLNVSPKRIVAVQGPFSYDMNRIMFHDTKASVVVMKNSGLVGGADTKLQAAMDLGIHVIVIDRPRVKLESHVVSTNDEFFKLWEDTNGLR